MKRSIAFRYSLFAQATLVAVTAYCGLFIAGTYSPETSSWYVQSIGQDIVDLFIIVPVLVITGMVLPKRKIFPVIFAGTELYIIYTFLIYCFSLHFNYLFLVYCSVLGLSVYSFIYCLAFFNLTEAKNWNNERVPVKLIGIYLIAKGILFYFLWLSDIIPAILHNTIPAVIAENGLFTNPVYVIDISLILPGFIIAGINLMKRISIGFLLAPVMLLFGALMSVSIAVLVVVMNQRGIEDSFTVAWLMVLLSSTAIFLLYLFFRHPLNKTQTFPLTETATNKL